MDEINFRLAACLTCNRTSSILSCGINSKGDNLVNINMNAIMQTMYEYIKYQDYIHYHSLYKMSKNINA